MKKLYASLLAGLLLAATALSAQAQTIRRVNNTGIPGVDVAGSNIYSTVQLAHNAAVAGDIIQLEPSTTSYGTLNCSKAVSVVGPGYFLSFNQPPALQASVIPASLDNVFFNSGSAGASMAGVTVNSNVYLSASSVSFVRNYVASNIYIGYQAAASNLVIRQNYVGYINYNNYTNNNVLITNNIVTGSVNLSSGGINGEFANNAVVYLYGTSYFDNFTLRNNYFGGGLVTTANTTWQYNLLNQASLPTLGSQSNNTANVPQSNVFVLGPGSTQFDAWYQLKAGTNPARGAGQGGVDIGPFGSATGYAYKLAGIPAIPTIYQLTQSVSGNTLNVNLSTRSNN